METMAQRVIRLRIALDMSQRELARRSGISQATASRIELGTAVKLRNSTIMALAQSLNTNPIYLVTGEGNPAPWTRSVVLMMQDLSSLPEEKQAAIAVIVQSLIEQNKSD